MDGVLMFAFIGGVVATVNPCGFALLPAYLARRINAVPGDNNAATIVRALGVGAATTSGFLIVFGLTGIIISLGASWVLKYLPWAGLIIGVFLILMGVFLMSGRKISIRLPVFGGQKLTRSWSGDLLFGISYGTASLSCTLPIFLSVTGVAITGSLAGSALTFVAYALGMGTVLGVLAIAAAMTCQGFSVWPQKANIYIDYFSGGLMALSGFYVVFYWGISLFLPDVASATNLITYGDKIISPVRQWLSGQVGTTVILALALFITLFLIRASWSRLLRKSG